MYTLIVCDSVRKDKTSYSIIANISESVLRFSWNEEPAVLFSVYVVLLVIYVILQFFSKVIVEEGLLNAILNIFSPLYVYVYGFPTYAE